MPHRVAVFPETGKHDRADARERRGAAPRNGSGDGAGDHRHYAEPPPDAADEDVDDIAARRSYTSPVNPPAHHEDVPFPSIEAVIVYIVDAISGGRPGARHEDVQEYIKRIADIEDAAKKQPGVIDVYALQAGRELRVVVRPDVVSEDQMIIMAQNIKEDIEKKFPTFPGQVNITVLRESRASLKTHG